MKSQKINTKAMTLGPFLTLILLSSPGRAKATHEARRSATREDLACAYGSVATQEEIFNLTPPRPPAPITPGPFLSLILAS